MSRSAVTVCDVSYHTHISRSVYDIMYISNVMHSAYKLVVYNHMNLVRIHHRARMYLVCYVLHMTRRDHHVMMSRSPIRMMRRSRS